MLKCGDRVRILAGPFKVHLAIYAGMSAHERVAVLLQILGGPQRVALAERDVSDNILTCSTRNPGACAIASVRPVTRPGSVPGRTVPVYLSGGGRGTGIQHSPLATVSRRQLCDAVRAAT
jgi:hypothetical protein